MVAFGALGWDAVTPDNIDGGFVPYSRRTVEQRQQFGHFRDRVPRGRFSVRGEIPDRCLFADVYRVATAGLCPARVFQTTGSCVGAATFLVCQYVQACDIVLRGSQEQIFLINPYFAWGVSRRKAGMRSPGEGSFGGAMAWALQQFGQVPIDASFSPKPEKVSTPEGSRSAWYQWSPAVERKLSWPAGWPTSEAEVAQVANGLQVEDIERVATVEDYVAACIAGRVPTIAGMFGSRPAVIEGFLVGEWNTTWSHQESGGGFIKHPQLGLLFEVDNQWGHNPYGAVCPFLASIGLGGSLWVTEKTMGKILHDDDTECWVFKDTEDKPAPTIDAWDSLANAA